MRIFLVRHGQSNSNVDKQLLRRLPDQDVGLTELGHEQAVQAGVKLAELIDRPASMYGVRIWTSPYQRARQTAFAIHQQIQGMGVDLREHVLLAEQQFGLFDGIPDEELPNVYPDEYAHYAKHEGPARFYARMPLGESRFDVAVRVHQAFGTFHRDLDKHGIDTLVVVGHGVTLRAFAMMWLHKTVEWFEKQPNPKNCAIRLIDDNTDHGYIWTPSKETPPHG